VVGPFKGDELKADVCRLGNVFIGGRVDNAGSTARVIVTCDESKFAAGRDF
jgi:hypothetical protein